MSVAFDEDQRAAKWAEFTAESNSRFSARFEFQPLSGESVVPEMEFHSSDGVAISRGVMPALRVANHGSSWPDWRYHVFCADQESVLVTKGRGVLRLAPAELVICRPEIPGEWIIERPYTVVAFHIDEGLFRRHVSNPMTLVGRRLGLPPTLNDVLVRIMDASIALSKVGGFGAAGRNLACSFLHTLALVPGAQVSQEHDEYHVTELRRGQIKTFIQKNYAKFDLSTKDIADYLNITPRYVQMALAPDGLTPSTYLRICRLEAARRLLMSPSFSTRSITDIAFECGFANSAHFSTEFRKRFGKSPRIYRHLAPALRAPTVS